MKLSKLAALAAAVVIAPLSAQAMEFGVEGNCTYLGTQKNRTNLILPKGCAPTTGDLDVHGAFNITTRVVSLSGNCNGISFKPVAGTNTSRVILPPSCALVLQKK